MGQVTGNHLFLAEWQGVDSPDNPNLFTVSELGATPVVADNTARAVMFPNPQGNERVFNLSSGNQERYSATQAAWVADFVIVLTPLLFGGDPTGVADSSAAILATANAAATLTVGGNNVRARAHLPAGIWKVTTSAAFTPTVSTSARGVSWTGDGYYASIVRYGTLSGATWLYDNGSTPRQSFNTFTGIGFEGMNPASFSVATDIPTNAKGFKITATGATGSNEQGFKYYNCRFSYFDTLFDMEGNATASEMKFFGCKVSHIKTTFYTLNNVQSFDHEFYGCDVENVFGDVFSTLSLGGGAIKVYGGSWIMSDRGDSVNTYFFKTAGAQGLGGSPNVFSGIRFEFHGDYSNLLSLPDAKENNVAFVDCMLEQSGTTSANKTAFCTVAGYATAKFVRCGFYEFAGGQMQFVANGAARYGQEGTITFDNCDLPTDWSDRCSIGTVSGHIRAINCHGNNIGALAAGVHYAHDFDYHWDEANAGQVGTWTGVTGTIRDDGSPTDGSFRLKTMQLKLTSEFWPSVAEHTLKLPKNAIIKAIHIRKPAASADATVTTMVVGRNDKSGTPHLTSSSAAMNLTHTGDVNDYYYHVGATTNERTLRLYSSAVTSGAVKGGLMLVEYY